MNMFGAAVHVEITVGVKKLLRRSPDLTLR
jgi:hypothetical protein